MFPRRSAVLRASCVLGLLVALLLIWMAGPDKIEGVSLWRHLLFEMRSVNETQVRMEFDLLKVKVNSSVSSENRTLEEIFHFVQDLKKQLPVNPHDFRYLINPQKLCAGHDVFLLVYVHSAPAHYKRRAAIRDTWGGRANFDDLTFFVIFLVGKPKEASVQDALYMESDMYGDLVQEDFEDSYRNLTYKAILGLRWVTTHCRHARYVLKADDDIFVNIFNVVAHLRSTTLEAPGGGGGGGAGGIGGRRLLLCLVWYRMKVVRDPKSKWYLSKEEYREDFFPTYCSGSAFMMTADVVEAMYKASFDTPFFWVDDFYVTGLLAKKVGVEHRKLNSVYVLGPSTFLDKFSEESKWRTLTFGHVHNLNQMMHVWNKVLQERRPPRNGGVSDVIKAHSNRSGIGRFIS